MNFIPNQAIYVYLDVFPGQAIILIFFSTSFFIIIVLKLYNHLVHNSDIIKGFLLLPSVSNYFGSRSIVLMDGSTLVSFRGLLNSKYRKPQYSAVSQITIVFKTPQAIPIFNHGSRPLFYPCSITQITENSIILNPGQNTY